MLGKRAGGVLMPLSSLPSPYGIGVMGEQAKGFVRKIRDMGFSWWQVLPLNPPDAYGSPYASESAFAISPLYIDPQGLQKMGLVSEKEAADSVFPGSEYTADYGFAAKSRAGLLRLAYQRADTELKRKIDAFCAENPWCGTYSLFKAAKELFGGKTWTQWGEKFARFETAEQNAGELCARQGFYKFVQYIAFSQWGELRRYANGLGVSLLGDMPIYVSFDSSDVWSSRGLFELDERSLACKRVSGVPPDYFAKEGQLWGNPLYDWSAMERNGFCWWCGRLRSALRLYDMVRIDHFRAFASYWAVPADSAAAKDGHWEKGPGMKLFDAVRRELGEVPIVAEDLGTSGRDVEELLRETGFPGMRVIQFGFYPHSDSTHLPHNYTPNTAAYIGTHDNAPLLTWLWEAAPEDRRFALDYCSFCGDDWGAGGFRSPACRSVIETVWRSPAGLAVISLQDMCGFGSDARMNVPGRKTGNWLFRTTEDTLRQLDAAYYRRLNDLFRRGGD